MSLFDYRKISIHNEGRTEDLVVLDDLKNAEKIIKLMFQEHLQIAKGEFSKPTNEKLVSSVKRRLAQFKKNLQKEFLLQSEIYLGENQS